jgi:hypothetical protein
MLRQEKLLSLIGQIYDAAADARLWAVFMQAYADTVDGSAAAIVYYDIQKCQAVGRRGSDSTQSSPAGGSSILV